MNNPNPNQEDIAEPTPAEWSWQANASPWTPNQERTWKEYAPDANKKIEEAYKSKQEIFEDLGDYYIDFKVMLQIHKNDHLRQRRVQRKTEGDLARSRAERFSGLLSPIKTISKSINMTEEFFQKIKKLNFEAEQALKLSNPLNFLLKEVPELANLSLKKMIQEVQSQENKADKEIIEKIKAYIEGAVLEDEKSLPGNNLYPHILKSFTEECFIYKTIHRLLREDNPQKLKEWAPYILLLLYSFSGDKASWKKKKNKTEQAPSVLYRAAVLYKEDAEIYDKARNRYFCWNTFTSLSKKAEVIKKFAENFECHKGQYKMFFTIETKSYNESLSILDQLVDVTSFSVFPEEEEVLVCPGTIFEILDTQIKDDSFYVTLRVVPEDEYWQVK